MRAPDLDLHHATVLVTGAAGFIGSHLVKALLHTPIPLTVVGLDNLNDYYDVSLKARRLCEIERMAARHPDSSWHFHRGNIADRETVEVIFASYRPTAVVHLAAQAGVRHSIEHPDAYIESNLLGFYRILEACRRHATAHLVYASSSSVYGGGGVLPFTPDSPTDTPLSLYAATKKSDELMAYAYAHLYGIPATGLRFFTVYGPSGRPDMAYFRFSERLRRGETVELYNHGRCRRDFTYIDDTVDGILRALVRPPHRHDGKAPHAVYNIGAAHPETLADFLTTLTEALTEAGILSQDFRPAGHIRLSPMQAGDMAETYADITEATRVLGYRPTVSLREGLSQFALWYRDFSEEEAPSSARREVVV